MSLAPDPAALPLLPERRAFVVTSLEPLAQRLSVLTRGSEASAESA